MREIFRAMLCIGIALVLLAGCGSADEEPVYVYVIPPSETPTNPGETPTNPGETPTNPGETPTNPGETPTNPSETPTNPSETPTNPGEPACARVCDRLVECGWMDRATCQQDACDMSGYERGDEAACIIAVDRLYDCLSQASCADLAEFVESDMGYVCETRDDAVWDACTEPWQPQWLSFTIEQVLIAPRKSDGHPWDEGGNISTADWQRYLELIGTLSGSTVVTTSSPVIAEILTIIGSATSKPDPYGDVRVDYDGFGFEPLYTLFTIGDTFTPQWSIDDGVDLPSNARWELELWDEDIVRDDPIGKVTITAAQLEAAAANGGASVWIPTATTKFDSIVAVKVTAIMTEY